MDIKTGFGSQFISFLENQGYNYILGNERVDNTPSLLNELDKIKPTHVISFIGRTHGKIGEKEFRRIHANTINEEKLFSIRQ